MGLARDETPPSGQQGKEAGQLQVGDNQNKNLVCQISIGDFVQFFVGVDAGFGRGPQEGPGVSELGSDPVGNFV